MFINFTEKGNSALLPTQQGPGVGGTWLERRQPSGGAAEEARTERFSWVNNKTQSKHGIFRTQLSGSWVTPESMTLSLRVHHHSNSSPGTETNIPTTESGSLSLWRMFGGGGEGTCVCYVQSQQCGWGACVCYVVSRQCGRAARVCYVQSQQCGQDTCVCCVQFWQCA